jgi:hypothetical protein
MRSLHAIVLGFLAVFSTSPLYGQWNEATPGQMSTGNFVAIGSGTAPDQRSALRLSNPVGETSAPCSTYQPVLHKCLQLAFSTPAAQWWAFRLDANNDLHLIRQYGPFQNDSSFKEGVTFTREGKVAINGGSVPLRIDAINAGGFGAEFVDLTTYGYPNGVALQMTGNSSISVSNLQIGNLTYPVIRSNTSTSPLYLNLWQTTDVVIGGPEASYANMGLRVRGTGMSAFSGALGIGTATPDPAYKLHVVGNANFEGTVTGTNIKAKFQDVAEWVPSVTPLMPATVVVLDAARSNHVTPSARSYDTSVAGVVSAQPGIILGEEGPSKALIATTGRVLVRVDASRQPIAIGDLLVTSDKPGLAMKSIPIDLHGIGIHRPGTLVGKALESLDSGEGEILVLLSLQ